MDMNTLVFTTPDGRTVQATIQEDHVCGTTTADTSWLIGESWPKLIEIAAELDWTIISSCK